MMYKKLYNKITSWKKSSVVSFYNNQPLPVLPETYFFIHEYDDDGLYIYDDHQAIYYHNDGSTFLLTDEYLVSDWYVLKALYDSNTVPMSIPVEFTEYKHFGYYHFQSPTGHIGDPWIIQPYYTTEYWIKLADIITNLIVALKEGNHPFPSDAINLPTFIYDGDNSYYSHASGTNRIVFNNTCNFFITEQFKRFKLYSINIREALVLDPSRDELLSNINWTYIRKYIKEKWLPLRITKPNL